MKALTLIITICAASFITTGVLAQTPNTNSLEAAAETSSNENSKVSVAQAVSLFNFISLTKVEKDSTEYDSGNSSIRILDFIQALF